MSNDPASFLELLRSKYNVGFAGIRKPRLGNTANILYARGQGWLLPESYGYAGRNINFSIAAVREWYAEQQEHFLTDGNVGVRYWWDDELEQYDTQAFWWNVAHRLALAAKFPNDRFFSINRAFSIGTGRLGASIWTGDTSAVWDDLQRTTGYILNWGMSGIPLVTCDIGGFNSPTNGELLSRWYQVGVFMGVMRVHSTLSTTPHWPWLFGDEAEASMRASLNLRYQLLPYFYSQFYSVSTEGKLFARPLMAEFLQDENTYEITGQWLVGRLMPAPVRTPDNTSNVYFPAGVTWFEFNSTTTVQGTGQNQTYNNVPLDQIPLFVQSPAIITLAPVVQATNQLPGGPLQVQIYANGSDTSFTMVEDDGETLDYQKGTVRKTTFTWNDASSTLSWTVQNSQVSNPTDFTNVFATLYRANQSPKSSSTQAISTSGSISFN